MFASLYLDHFDHEDEGEGKQGGHQQQRDGREKVGEHPRPLVTSWNIADIMSSYWLPITH